MQFTRASGKWAEQLKKASSRTSKEKFTKGLGTTTRLRGMGLIFTRTELSTRDTGNKICNMARERKHGLMGHSLSANTGMVRKME